MSHAEPVETETYQEQPYLPIHVHIDSATSHYSDEDRRLAVVLYLEHGKGRRVAELTGIPDTTISMWRKSEWWDDLAAAIRTGLEDETRGRLQAIVHKALDATVDRLDNGESYVSKGEIIRVPVKARDATLIACMAYDKLRLSMNLPSRIADSSGVQVLADQLAKLSEQLNARTVSEQ